MKPKDSADIQFAARLVLDELVSRALMQQVLQTQTELIERGKPMTVAQICVAKKWLSRAEARLLLAGEQAPSDLVEGFTILQRLGTGGMSQVFLAEDKESGEEVALKVLKPHLARRTTALERFRREAELLIRFACAGAGITTVPEYFAAPHVQRGELRRVLPDWHPPSIAAWAVFPGRRLMPAKTRAFLDMLQAALGDEQHG